MLVVIAHAQYVLQRLGWSGVACLSGGGFVCSAKQAAQHVSREFLPR